MVKRKFQGPLPKGADVEKFRQTGFTQRRAIQGPLPKGTTAKQEEDFRRTGVTSKVVGKQKRRLILKKLKSGFRLPKLRTDEGLGKVLRNRKSRTLQKILNSQASPIEKARARLMLERLK